MNVGDNGRCPECGGLLLIREDLGLVYCIDEACGWKPPKCDLQEFQINCPFDNPWDRFLLGTGLLLTGIAIGIMFCLFVRVIML